MNKILNKLLLKVLEYRLKRYEKDAKWYEDRNNYNNWYHEHGIPDLKNKIKELRKEIYTYE